MAWPSVQGWRHRSKTQSDIHEQDLLSAHDDASWASVASRVAEFEGIDALEHQAAVVVPDKPDLCCRHGFVQELQTFRFAYDPRLTNRDVPHLHAVEPEPDNTAQKEEAQDFECGHRYARGVQ